MSPNRHSDGYQAAYQRSRSRTASWVRQHLPSVWAAARGDKVGPEQVKDELRRLADADELEMP